MARVKRYEHKWAHGQIDLNHFCIFCKLTQRDLNVVDVKSENQLKKKCSILRPFQRLNERRKFRYKQGENGTAPKIIVEPPTPSPGASFSERKKVFFFYSDILFAFLSHVHSVIQLQRWSGYYTNLAKVYIFPSSFLARAYLSMTRICEPNVADTHTH